MKAIILYCKYAIYGNVNTLYGKVNAIYENVKAIFMGW